jgi:hypothetical protein
MHPETIIPPSPLPIMLSKETIDTVSSLAKVASNTIVTVMMSNVVISILIAGTLQHLLNTVKKLQIIVHIMLINLAYPATTTIFFSMLM